MVGFIEDQRDVYGVEPICKVLPIAPATYYEHRRRRLDPSRRPARALRDDFLRAEIRHVWEESFGGVYGARKVWQELRRRGVAVARCTVEWVHWFNSRRLLEPLGYRPPVEYEATYHQQKQAPVAMAGLN